MGGSRAQVNKAHKSRFSTKSSRNLHKTSVKGSSSITLFFFEFIALFKFIISFNFLCLLIKLFCELDKSRIAKSERNVAKGARAARVQRNKMVTYFSISFVEFNFWKFFQIIMAVTYIITKIVSFVAARPETGGSAEREEGFNWNSEPSPCCSKSFTFENVFW